MRKPFPPGTRVIWGRPNCNCRGEVVDDDGGEIVKVKGDNHGHVEDWYYDIDGQKIRRIKP